MRKQINKITTLNILFLALNVLTSNAQDIRGYAANTLYDQYTDIDSISVAISTNHYINEDSTIDLSAGTAYIADDFIIPVDETWNIGTFAFKGKASDESLIHGFNLNIYSDNNGKPGSLIVSYEYLDYIYNNGDFLAILPEPLELAAGNYWIAPQPVSFSTPISDRLSWSWYYQQDTSEALQNNYPKYAPLNNAGYWSTLNNRRNLAFSVHEAPSKDIGCRQLINPAPGYQFSTDEVVNIVLYNFGTEVIDTIIASYSINKGTTWKSDTLIYPLQPKEEFYHVFFDSVNVSSPGIYEVLILTLAHDDNNQNNDTIGFVVENKGDIYKISDSHNSTIKTCSGLFTDAGGINGKTDNTSYITTIEPLNSTSRIQLDFDVIHLAYNDTLIIYDGINNAAPALLKTNNNPQTVTATNSAGALTIEYKSVNTAKFDGWIANISCIEANDIDLAVTSLDAPRSAKSLSTTENIQVTIKNFGYQAQRNIPISYAINGGAPVYETITATINAGETFQYTFLTTADLSAYGNYEIDVNVNQTNDKLLSNNANFTSIYNYDTLFNIADHHGSSFATCHGLFTDDGGLNGTVAKWSNYLTTIFPATPGDKVSLYFKEVDLDFGTISIYDGINTSGQLLTESSGKQITNTVYAYDTSGAITVAFSNEHNATDGWEAIISCYTPDSSDAMIEELILEPDIFIQENTHKILAVVRNSGIEDHSYSVSLFIDNSLIETHSNLTLLQGMSDTISFEWIADTMGEKHLKIELSDDDNSSNNSDSLIVNVLSKNLLFENFEGQVFPPLFWTSASDKFVKAYDELAPAGDSVLTLSLRADTLFTPILNIQSGDTLEFYIKIDPVIIGYLSLGWVDGITGVQTMFSQELVLKSDGRYEKVEFPLDEAIGANRIAFYFTEGVHAIDMVFGPEIMIADKDIALQTLLIDNVCELNNPVNIGFVIQNFGEISMNEGDYTLSLYKKGNPDIPVLTSIPGIELDFQETDTLWISPTFNYTEYAQFYALIECDGDLNQSNDTSSIVPVSLFPQGFKDIDVVDSLKMGFSRYLPIAMDTKYSASEFIIKHEQLQYFGSISAISFYPEFATPVEPLDIEIYLGTTTDSVLNDGWINSSILTKVYSGAISLEETEKEIYIHLQKSYLYSRDNLVVLVYNKNNTNSEQFFNSSFSTINVGRYHSSATSFSTDFLSAEGTATNAYPNTSFIISSKVGTVQVTVKNRKDETVEEAVLNLEGIESYQAVSDSEGIATFSEVIINSEYELTIQAENYIRDTKNWSFSEVNTLLPDQIMEIKHKPFTIIPEVINDQIVINWTSSQASEEYNPILVDASLESIYSPEINTLEFVGNRINVTEPVLLEGFFVWALNTDPYSTPGKNTVVVMDTLFNIIIESDEFYLPNRGEMYVDLPDITITTDYFLMVKWDSTHSNVSSKLGFDSNGPYNLGYRGNFKNGITRSGGTFTIFPSSKIPKNTVVDHLVVGYDLYMGERGDEQNIDQWTKVNNVPIKPVDGKVKYYDYDWPPSAPGNYVYASRTLYTSDTSGYVFSSGLKYGINSNATININVLGGNPTGALVELRNNDGLNVHTYSQIYDGISAVEFGFIEFGTYTLRVIHPDYEDYLIENLEFVDANHEVTVDLVETIIPPFDPKVTDLSGDGSTTLLWNGYGETKELILDDGVFESGLTMNPFSKASLGNYYDNKYSASISKISIIGLENEDSGSEEVYLEIFDITRNLIAQSDSFMIPADGTAEITFEPEVTVDGGFYIMVVWDSLSGPTNFLALDLQPTFTNKQVNYYYDNNGWAKINSFAPSFAGVFGIRPMVTVSGGGSENTIKPLTLKDEIPKVGVNVFKPAQKPNPFAFRQEKNLLFNVYLNDFITPLATDVSDFHYVLTGISSGSHSAGVSSVYSSGESEIVKVDFNYYNSSGIYEQNSLSLQLFPNPAKDYCIIKNGLNTKGILVNELGKVLQVINIDNTDYRLNLEDYREGTYILYINDKGHYWNTKIIITN